MADSNETPKTRPNITPLLLPKPYFKDTGTVLRRVQAPESPRTSRPSSIQTSPLSSPTEPNSPSSSESNSPTPKPRPRPQVAPKPDLVTLRGNSIEKERLKKSLSTNSEDNP